MIRQCGTSSGSRHKDTDQCLLRPVYSDTTQLNSTRQREQLSSISSERRNPVRVSIATQLNSTRRRVELSCVSEVSIAICRCNSSWVELRRYTRALSRHFLLQAPQCPCSVWKRFSRDHCCRGRSKPSCRIKGSHTRWELTTWADFQLCLYWLLMSTGCKSSHSGFLDVSRIAMVGWGYQAGLANCHVWRFSPPACQWHCGSLPSYGWRFNVGEHWKP